jgi:hypothetical protein
MQDKDGKHRDDQDVGAIPRCDNGRRFDAGRFALEAEGEFSSVHACVD